MYNNPIEQYNEVEKKFLQMYKVIQEREDFLSNDAKMLQYIGIIRYFTKFIQSKDKYSSEVKYILFWVNVKIGDIYYNQAVQNSDNNMYFLAIEYYNQALLFASNNDERDRVLLILKEIYMALNDEDAFLKVEESWAENRQNEDKFFAYTYLAEKTEDPVDKAKFLEKALDVVMNQDESFYTKYQDTLNICSQLLAIYEILGEKEKVIRVKKLREETLKLLS